MRNRAPCPRPARECAPDSIVPIFFCRMPRHFFELATPVDDAPTSAPFSVVRKEDRLSCTARVAAPAREEKLKLLACTKAVSARRPPEFTGGGGREIGLEDARVNLTL